MQNLSAVSEQTPAIQKQGVEVMLLNIHESPGKDVLERFNFTATPTYLIFDKNGDEIFRSNLLPSVDKIIEVAS